LSALRDKRQRTVYRLTLVKGWNTEEVKGYAELLELGQPDFIEIKGVTYCGSYVSMPVAFVYAEKGQFYFILKY
jgi:wyosine [tRNA(Phe)-imidazoG37] synthetase (radical SAM superfamily)